MRGGGYGHVWCRLLDASIRFDTMVSRGVKSRRGRPKLYGRKLS